MDELRQQVAVERRRTTALEEEVKRLRELVEALIRHTGYDHLGPRHDGYVRVNPNVTPITERPPDHVPHEHVARQETHPEPVAEIQAPVGSGVESIAVEGYDDALPHSDFVSNQCQQGGVTRGDGASTEMQSERNDAYKPVSPVVENLLAYSALEPPGPVSTSIRTNMEIIHQNEGVLDALQEYGSVVSAQEQGQAYAALSAGSVDLSTASQSRVQDDKLDPSYAALDSSSLTQGTTAPGNTCTNNSTAYGALPSCQPGTSQTHSGSAAAAMVSWHAPSEGAADWNVHWQAACDLPTSTALQRSQRSVVQFSICQQFTVAAQQTVMTLVDDLLKPKAERRLSSVNVGGIAGGEKFVHEGIFFKFARDWQGVYGGDAYAMKAASLELSNLRYYMNLAAPLDPSQKLSVPLATLIDYGGYRVLATSILPIDGKDSLVYGSADAANTVHADVERVNAMMARAASDLNLKPHYVGSGEQMKLLAGPADIEVHAAKDGRYYVLDTARVFPPEAPSTTAQAFLIHAEPLHASAASAVASTVTVLDISRAKSLAEIASVLSTMSVLGADSAANQATHSQIQRIELPGAGLYVRSDANQHLRAARGQQLFQPVPPDVHATYSSLYGYNRIATAILRSISKVNALDSSSPSSGGIIYGDAVVIAAERGQHLYHCLRPEAVFHSSRTLSSDAFTRFGLHDAASHNAEVALVTKSLLNYVMPLLASAIRNCRHMVVTSHDFIRAIHTEGLNVRHIGMLRVLLEGTGKSNSSSPLQTLVIKRLRDTLLNEMVTRVLKQLLREALRSVADSAAVSAPITLSRAAEDPRVALLRSCLNVALAQEGAWAPDSVESNVRRPAQAPKTIPIDNRPSQVIWNTIIRTHIQLKFGSQLPALSSAELRPSFDLRSSLSPSVLAASLSEQLGVQLRPSALQRLLAGSSPTSLSLQSTVRETPRAVCHPHDVRLLPRRKLHPSIFRPTVYDAPSGVIPAPGALLVAPEGKVLLKGMFPTPAQRIHEHGRFMDTIRAANGQAPSYNRVPIDKGFARSMIAKLNESPNDEEYFALTYGVNFAYSTLASFFDDQRVRLESLRGSNWIESIAEYYAAGRRWSKSICPAAIATPSPSVPVGGDAVSDFIRQGDIQSIVAVSKPIVTSDSVMAAIEHHPSVCSLPKALVRASIIANVMWPSFEPLWSSANVQLSCMHTGYVVGASADADTSNRFSSTVVHPTDTALLCPGERGPAFCVANMSFFRADTEATGETEAATSSVQADPRDTHVYTIDAMLATGRCVAWDIVLHPGFDLDGLRVGVAKVPLHWGRENIAEGSWLFVPAAASTIVAGRELRREDSLKARGLTVEQISLLKQNGRWNVWREPDDVADVLTLVFDLNVGLLRLFINSHDIYCTIDGIPLPGEQRCDSLGGEGDDAIQPIIYCHSSNSNGKSKCTLRNVRGNLQYRLMGAGGGFNVNPSQAERVRSSWNAGSSTPADTAVGASIDTLLALNSDISGSSNQQAVETLLYLSVPNNSPVQAMFSDDFFRTEATLTTDAVLALNRYYLCMQAFGAQDRICTDAAVKAAEILIRSSAPNDAVGVLLKAFSTIGISSYPKHALIRAYVALGDCCLLDTATVSREQRSRNAETWYTRAFSVLQTHVQQPAICNFIANLTAAANGTVTDAAIAAWKRYSERTCTDAGLEEQLHPYTLVVIDRLLGVLRAQDRAHHAKPLVVLFVDIWQMYPCPVSLGHFASAEASGTHLGREEWDKRTRLNADKRFGYAGCMHPLWRKSPIEQVFDRAMPHAVAYANEYRVLLNLPKDLFGKSPNIRDTHAVQVAHWVAKVSSMEDQGAMYDVEAPVGLGMLQFGPVPASYIAAGSAAITNSSIRGYASQLQYNLRNLPTNHHQPTSSTGKLFTWHQQQQLAEVILPLVVSPESVEQVVDFDAARMFSVAVTSFGRVLVWAPDASSSLTMRDIGVGDSDAHPGFNVPHPLRVLHGKHITQVACGADFVGLLDREGVVYTYGKGDFGVLGHGDTTSRNTPRAVRGLEGIQISVIAAGSKHFVAAATTPSKTVTSMYSWGQNEYGCCGIGSAKPVLSPHPVTGIYRPQSALSSSSASPEPARIQFINAADSCTVAISQDGLLYRFGNFSWIADPDCKATMTPTLVVPQYDPLLPPTNSAGTVLCAPGVTEKRSFANGIHEVSGVDLPQISAFFDLVEQQTTMCAPDLTVRFVHAAVSRANLFAVSTDGRLWSQGRHDLGETAHDSNGTSPHTNLVRVKEFGPIAAVHQNTLEASTWQHDKRARAVYADGNSGGFVVLQSVSQNRFSLWHWGSANRWGLSAEELELSDTGSAVASSHAGGPECVPHVVLALSDVECNIRKLAGLSDRFGGILLGQPAHMPCTLADPLVDPCANQAAVAQLAVFPNVVFPGQQVCVEYFVPHGGGVLNDGVLVRSQSAECVFADIPVWVKHAVTQNCAGSFEITAPSAPGTYVVTYFIGFPAATSSFDSFVKRWSARVETTFQVVASVADGKGGRKQAVEIQAWNAMCPLDNSSRPSALVSLRFNTILHPKLSLSVPFKLPLQESDTLALVPIDALGRLGGVKGDSTESSSLVGSPRPAYMSLGMLKGDGYHTIAGTDSGSLFRCTSWTVVDLLGGHSASFQPQELLTAGKVDDDVCLAAELHLDLEASQAFAPGRYAFVFVTSSQSNGKKARPHRLDGLAMLSSLPLQWALPILRSPQQLQGIISSACLKEGIIPECCIATCTAYIKPKTGASAARAGDTIRSVLKFCIFQRQWQSGDVVCWISKADLLKSKAAAQTRAEQVVRRLEQGRVGKPWTVYQQKEWATSIVKHTLTVEPACIVKPRELRQLASDPATVCHDAPAAALGRSIHEDAADKIVQTTPDAMYTGIYRVSFDMEAPSEAGKYCMLLCTQHDSARVSENGMTPAATGDAPVLAVIACSDEVHVSAPMRAVAMASPGVAVPPTHAAAASTNTPTSLPHPAYTDWELYHDSGAPTKLGLDTSGPEHDMLIENVMAVYSMVYQANNVPPAMVPQLLASITPQISAVPNISLVAMLESLRSQLMK